MTSPVPLFFSVFRLFRPGADGLRRGAVHPLHAGQRVRDEAHRFGIIHHRTLRQKAALHSKLEEIPGIGPARRKELLKAFGSLKAIREADTEALTRVKGMNRAAAESVRAWAEQAENAKK